MEITQEGFEQEIYQFIDKIKDLLSPQILDNILLDCSKNEILVLWLLYRRGTVNMSQIAEYIHVPLNTATGIVARMEKRELVIRERSAEDKRIVFIRSGTKGTEQMQAMIKEFMHYGTLLMANFSQEEIILLLKMIDKLMGIMETESQNKIEEAAEEKDFAERDTVKGNTTREYSAKGNGSSEDLGKFTVRRIIIE